MNAGPLTCRPAALYGWLCGAVAALIWAAFQVLTKHGLSGAGGGGFRPMDLQLFRFGAPGVLLMPVAITRGREEMRRLGWRRLAMLTLCSGPLLGLTNFEGYSMAPLSHGAVLFPAFTTLWGMLLAGVVLGTRHTRAQHLGLVLIVAGLMLVGGLEGGTPRVRLGDALFCVAGLMWGGYTVLLRRWTVNGLLGAAIVGLWSSVLAIGLYAVAGDFGHLMSIPRVPFWTQAIFQGVFAGVLAVVAFGYSVQHLGASKAALFPATVPLLALSAGVLAFGAEVRTVQWIGLQVTTLGLLFAVGVLRRQSRTAPQGATAA
jgi:drug/metabolite transporter (DMT)-like permease